jgi:diguanylate cyclase (GGDEF)-like protein
MKAIPPDHGNALRPQAYRDPLTGLPNRELFNDRLEAALNQAKRHRRVCALLLVELGDFKEIIANLGLAAGGELLVEAARRLASCVRESDTVARLGGDGFAIILTEVTHAGEVESIARRVVGLLSAPYHLDAGTARIPSGIGIAIYPQHGQDSEQLQRNADTALCAAQEFGGNTCHIYSSIQRGDKLQGDLL